MNIIFVYLREHRSGETILNVHIYDVTKKTTKSTRYGVKCIINVCLLGILQFFFVYIQNVYTMLRELNHFQC